MTGPDDLSDFLTDQERILMAAWMLPNDGVLTDEQRRQTLTNFTQYCSRHQITFADVGRQLGSPRQTTIGDLVKGIYRAKTDEHIRKLNMWVEQDARRRAASVSDAFVASTKVAKALFVVARLVRENGTMGLALGPSGIGKSRCGEALHEKYVGSLFLRIHRECRTPKGFIHALADKLQVRTVNRTVTDRQHRTQFERVLDALRDSSRLLIIDEAHKLNDDAIDLLRDLHDITGIPVLLLATRDLHDRILKDADPDHGQLYSRFDVVHHLTEGKNIYDDGESLATMDDIRAMYNQPPVKLSKDAAKYLFGAVNELGKGCYRRGKRLVRNAAIRARKRQRLPDGAEVTVTADDLDWAERHLRQELSEHAAITDRQSRASRLASA